MKKKINLTTSFIFYSFVATNLLFGQNNKKIVFEKTKSVLTDVSESINICKWKYDTQTCMNFSFDDNNISHKKISELLNQYNFKGTFFVITSYMYSEIIKDLIKNGHEIGNHSYSHVNLSSSTIDSSEIDFQIRHSKLMIENSTGIKCLSFTEPFHAYSNQSKKNVLENHLFDRDYSQYFSRDFYEMNPTSSIEEEKTFIENKIKDKKIILFTGHGIDGDGSEPISSDFLNQTLELINEHVLSGDLWVTTIKEGVQYENLYQEIQLEKSIIGDTMKLVFNNFNKFKYKDCEKAPISITIPKIVDCETTCLTNSAEIKEHSNRYIITTDLMRDTTILILIKPIGIVTEDKKIDNDAKFIIFPNPAIDFININSVGSISVIEILNMNGQLQIKQNNNSSKVDISKLAKGCYLTKIIHHEGHAVFISYERFIKI